jgi:ABC-type nitrate/sulfonate/bicarbonate transport system permease component
MRTRLIALAIVVGGWEIAARSGWIPATVLPPFSSVLVSLVRQLGQHNTWYQAYVSAWEIVVGFAIGTAAGLVFAAITTVIRALWTASEPVLYYLSSLPKIILFPVLLLYLSTGIFSKVGMGAVSAFFPVAITAAQALHEVPQVQLRAARTLGAGRRKLLMHVYLPAAAEPVLSGLRLGLAVAVTGVLLAETSAASAGLGWQAMQDYDNLRITDMYALLLLAFFAAVLLNVGIGRLIRYVTRYNHHLA